MDTHRQGEVAFAFCRLLGFQLMPHKADRHKYPALAPILKSPIDWKLVRRQ